MAWFDSKTPEEGYPVNFSAINDVMRKPNAYLQNITPEARKERLKQETLADPEFQASQQGALSSQQPEEPVAPIQIVQETQEALENPGATLSQRNVEYSYPDAQLPAPRHMEKPRMVMKEAEELTGKQVMFDMNAIPKWNESQAFNQGLISFGLNLLAGNDLATSFNQAANHFNDAYGREKREIWAQDLMQQGFDAHEIQAWVETGDQKSLTDPAEKIAKAQQQRMAQLQLQKAEYEASPEYQDWLAQKDYQEEVRKERKLQLDELQTRTNIAKTQQSMRLAEEDARQKQAGAAEKFKKDEHQARMYYLRGVQGMNNYNQLVQSNPEAYADQGFLGGLRDAIIIDQIFSGDASREALAKSVNPQFAEMVAAERAFLAPILRVESGAAISTMEWKTSGEQFFPRPGDSPARIAQKAQLREVAMAAMNPSASPELQDALETFSRGGYKDLRLVNGQVYVSENGKTYHKVNMFK